MCLGIDSLKLYWRDGQWLSPWRTTHLYGFFLGHLSVYKKAYFLKFQTISSSPLLNTSYSTERYSTISADIFIHFGSISAFLYNPQKVRQVTWTKCQKHWHCLFSPPLPSLLCMTPVNLVFNCNLHYNVTKYYVGYDNLHTFMGFKILFLLSLWFPID